MDIVVEILLEVYMELMLLVIPEKNADKKQIRTAKVMAIVSVAGILALFVWGLVLLTDYNDLRGMIPVGIAALLSLAQIIAGILLFRKHH